MIAGSSSNVTGPLLSPKIAVVLQTEKGKEVNYLINAIIAICAVLDTTGKPATCKTGEK